MPFIQLTHHASFSVLNETPFFLMSGRQARLPVERILSTPDEGSAADTEVFEQNTRDNLKIAFELARRKM